MKRAFIISILALASGMTFAGTDSALSLPGYFGSINNNTGYVIECSQVIGGYCANNPMPANGYIQMLPDPGSKEIRGHIMAYDKSVPGKYSDNLLFTYSEQKNGFWAFHIKSLDKHISVKLLNGDTVVLSKVGSK